VEVELPAPRCSSQASRKKQDQPPRRKKQRRAGVVANAPPTSDQPSAPTETAQVERESM